jgi:hypothetical protein
MDMQTQREEELKIAQTLPASMRYSVGSADAVSSSTVERMFETNNGNVFSPSGSNELRIPVHAGMGFLDTAKHHLEFTIKNKGGTAASCLDGDISCIIDQVRIEMAESGEIERLDGYSVLHNLKSVWNASYTDREMRNGRSGGPVPAIDNATNGSSLAHTSGSATFSTQIDSGFLMGHHKKALPMGLKSFTIVIRLNTAAVALIAENNATTPDYEITNARFYCPVYQLDDALVVQSYLAQVQERGLKWSGDTNKLYMGNLSSGASTKVIQLNDRSLSLKGFVTVLRPSATYNDSKRATNSSFNLTGCTQYHYSLGGMNYPQTPININIADEGLNIARAYDQCLKTFATAGKAYSEPLVNKAKFVLGDAAATAAAVGEGAASTAITQGVLTGQGALCLDTRRFDSERIAMVGLNTAKSASPSTLQIVTSADFAADTITNTYAIVEAEYVMKPNGIIEVNV